MAQVLVYLLGLYVQCGGDLTLDIAQGTLCSIAGQDAIGCEALLLRGNKDDGVKARNIGGVFFTGTVLPASVGNFEYQRRFADAADTIHGNEGSRMVR